MIQGYPDHSSAFPGDTITFRVSCPDAPQFRIDFYRQGATFDFVTSSSWFSGQPADDRSNGEDWSLFWPGYQFELTDDWSSGAYVAIFVEGDGNDSPNPNQDPPIDFSTPHARSGKALFVLKNPLPGVTTQLLYKLPLFTYTAYNPKGGASVYQGGCGPPSPPVPVSLHRPGNGTGGLPWDADPRFIGTPNSDCFDEDTPRQVFAHWDAKMISWLEGQGYRVDYCTDLDIHNDDDLSLLSPYALMLSVGHDEYYTANMRDHLEAFIANGGNMAFFSGNTSWWRVNFQDGPPLVFTRCPNWKDVRPEDALTGVSYRNGGERDFPALDCSDIRNQVGYTVQHTEQWPFENTGLNDNTPFGAPQGLVGYECDGTSFDKSAPRPVSPAFNPGDATPDGFMILGTADTSQWDAPEGNAAATMGMYSNSGTVFTGATTDWPRVVWQGESHTVQITKNILNRLGANPKGLAELSTMNNVIACDGFFSADDNFRHAIVATTDGGITELFFSPKTGTGQTVLATQTDLLDVGSFYTDDDQYRHVITATADGNIWEIFYSPQTALGQAQLSNVPNAVRVAGFFSGDDNYRHAIVATREGAVLEIFFNPNRGQGQVLLGTFNNIVDIGAFYSPDDNYRHAIVGTADGNVTEIYFRSDTGTFQTVIANVPDLAKVSAYYAANDKFFNRRVQVLTNGGRIHEIRYNPDFGIMRAVLFNTGGLVDIGSFFSADDNFCHALLATPDGDVQELFFNP